MVKRKGEPTSTNAETTTEKDSHISRRRCLKLAGTGLLGAALGTGSASAEETGWGPGSTAARDPESEYAQTTESEEESETESTAESDSESPADADVVGGGDGYENTVSADQADVVVGSGSELSSALESAASGDVVYVEGGQTIDMGSGTTAVPAGVTLASDRGIDGAPGGLLQTGTNSWPMITVGADARITGLRISGPHEEYLPYDENAVGMGLQCEGSGVELDNNEVFGFSHAAVRPSEDTHVHHNDIHTNPMAQLGYGVSVTAGEPLIEYNRMNYNRHSIAGSGGCGYTARYNHFGADAIDHVMDMHKPGGTTVEIHHNTVEATTHVQDDGTPEAVAIRGTPDDVATIHHNWFYNEAEPADTPQDWSGDAITQVHTSDWQNVTWSENSYGSAEPADDIGCPR